jgi:hypothetical protein
LTATVKGSLQVTGIAASAAQHPFPERHDQAGFFRHGDDMGRGDLAMHRMAPANQRFHTDLRASGENVLRLIDDLELLAAERKPQLLSRPCAAAAGGGARADRYRPWRGQARCRRAQELEPFAAIARRKRNADARGAYELLVGVRI